MTLAGIFSLLLTMSFTSPNIAAATHTTAGARYWKNVCKTLDAFILEDCSLLVSKHDPRGNGLSPLGYKVAICIGGGMLAIAGGHPEWIKYAPLVGCGVKR